MPCESSREAASALSLAMLVGKGVVLKPGKTKCQADPENEVTAHPKPL